MTPTEHPFPSDFARAVSLGPDEVMKVHFAQCGECASDRDAFVRLRALARALHASSPAPLDMRAVRDHVVTEAVLRQKERKRTRTAAAFVFAAAAGIALSVFVHRAHGPSRETAEAPRYHGTVTAISGARFVRSSGAPDEIVRLESGTIHVEVSPLHAGERFRVLAGDGEIEVRGTSFDVGVDDSHLALVHVTHGRVEVRPHAEPSLVLEGGGDWRTPDASNQPPTEAPPAIAPAPADETRTLPPPHSRATGAPGTDAPSTDSTAAPANTGIAAPTENVIAPVTNASAAPPSSAAPSNVLTPQPSSVPQATSPTPADDRAQERRERREERRDRNDERRLR
jgi:hypothetical protein